MLGLAMPGGAQLQRAFFFAARVIQRVAQVAIFWDARRCSRPPDQRDRDQQPPAHGRITVVARTMPDPLCGTSSSFISAAHTIDRWDDAIEENLIEQIAAVGDYLVALETYRAA